METTTVTNPTDAERALAREFADELRQWWSFDGGQRHAHSWHSREDFIARELPRLIAIGYRQGQEEMRGQCAAVVRGWHEGSVYVNEHIAAAIRALPITGADK